MSKKMFYFYDGDYGPTFTVMAENKEQAIELVKENISTVKKHSEFYQKEFERIIKVPGSITEFVDGQVIYAEIA